jgi:hypothetical protein
MIDIPFLAKEPFDWAVSLLRAVCRKARRFNRMSKLAVGKELTGKKGFGRETK